MRATALTHAVWLLLGSLCLPADAQQSAPARKFDPPRIIAVVRAPDTGLQESREAYYYINRGQETNLNRGEVLNAYRELRLVPGLSRPMRLFIGTITITESQNGSSVGTFLPNDNINQPIVRYKTPIKGDIVVPRLIIDSGVLFDPGKADLKPGVAEEFKKVADFVQNFSPGKIIIEGHTDSDGDEESNQVLSEARAEVVTQYLVNAYDFITLAMVEARGYGERQPIVSNDTPENRTLNRRIEVVVWD
jgi:outer membrane protein OmpA-like peptidoglycan-associated protein